MNTGPSGRVAADRALSDAASLLSIAASSTAPTSTTPPLAARPEHVSVREIAEFLHDLARFRSPAAGGDRGEHAALLARKTELLHRIIQQHTRTAANLPPTTATAPETGTP